MKRRVINLLLEVYDQAFDKPAWHGTNLRSSLKRLKIEELIWRPQSKRHNIWEIVLHCAYWKYVVYRKLTGIKKGSFPGKPSDWPAYPDKPTMKDWQNDLKLLIKQHELLREAIINFPENKLYKKPVKSKVSYIQNIYGASSHDLYHAGQIQLLKRLMK